MKRLLVGLAVLLLVWCGAACGGGGSEGGAAPAARSAVSLQQTPTLLVMGSSSTLGVGLDNELQDGWPRIFYREAFPRSTVFFNAATRDASVADAESNQLPLVDEVSPTVVAMWFGSVEASRAMPVAEFASDLEHLVWQVRASGARVLLADLPRSERFDVAPYNRAIARIASDQGATLVPLHDEPITSFDPSRTLPDARGHRTIARAFERALRNGR